MSSPSIATILRDHVSLSISCVDRLYLNGYVPLLQAPGQITTFCRQQLNAPILGAKHEVLVSHDLRPVIREERGQPRLEVVLMGDQ